MKWGKRKFIKIGDKNQNFKIIRLCNPFSKILTSVYIKKYFNFYLPALVKEQSPLHIEHTISKSWKFSYLPSNHFRCFSSDKHWKDTKLWLRNVLGTSCHSPFCDLTSKPGLIFQQSHTQSLGGLRKQSNVICWPGDPTLYYFAED